MVAVTSSEEIWGTGVSWAPALVVNPRSVPRTDGAFVFELALSFGKAPLEDKELRETRSINQTSKYGVLLFPLPMEWNPEAGQIPRPQRRYSKACLYPALSDGATRVQPRSATISHDQH